MPWHGGSPRVQQIETDPGMARARQQGRPLRRARRPRAAGSSQTSRCAGARRRASSRRRCYSVRGTRALLHAHRAGAHSAISTGAARAQRWSRPCRSTTSSSRGRPRHLQLGRLKLARAQGRVHARVLGRGRRGGLFAPPQRLGRAAELRLAPRRVGLAPRGRRLARLDLSGRALHLRDILAGSC